MKLLCVSAVKLELAWLLERLARPERTEVKGLKAWSGLIEGHRVRLACLGIGPAPARNAMESLLQNEAYARVYHFGLCGALSPGLDLCRPVLARSVAAAWDPSREPLALEPAPPGAFDSLELRPLEGAFVSNGLPVFNSQVKGFLAARFKADCVDMEAWEVARVCAERSMPLTVIKAVSDRADSSLPDTFRRQARPAALAAQQAVLELLRRVPG
ncbi:hypothetical protein LLH00_02280 [bacterium]|nr:hypothetical protein [bacterium]